MTALVELSRIRGAVTARGACLLLGRIPARRVFLLLSRWSRGYNERSMAPERHTRRSFLQGEVASREFVGQVHRMDEGVGIPSRQSLVVSVRRRAMACEFEVQLAAARNDDSMEHVFSALDLVEALESQLTIYRNDSEVVRINRRAGNEPVTVEKQLFGLLQQAQRLHQDTDGALDITSGPLSEAWGFSRREGRVPSDDQIEAARQLVGMQHVKLDAVRQTIAFRRAGMSINFNSLGKGYALDRMAELLTANGVDDFLLQGGKSSVLARRSAGIGRPRLASRRSAPIADRGANGGIDPTQSSFIDFRRGHAVFHSPRV